MKKIFLSSFLCVFSFSNHCSDSSKVVDVLAVKCFEQEDVSKMIEMAFKKGLNEGFESGLTVGADRGVSAGYEHGRNEGSVYGISVGISTASNLLTITDAIGEFKRGKSWKDSLKGAARTYAFGTAPRVISHILTKPDATNEDKQGVAAICGWLSLVNVLRIGYKNCKLVQRLKAKDSTAQTDEGIDLATGESFRDDEHYQKLVQSEHDMRQKYNLLKDDVIKYGNILQISSADKIILLELFPSLSEFCHPVQETVHELEPESAGAEWTKFQQASDAKKWRKQAGW
jgi:hypothetical protein